MLYARPPLSKGLWKNNSFEKARLGTEESNTDFHLGRQVTVPDPAAHCLRDKQDDEYPYDKLLLSNGSSLKKGVVSYLEGGHVRGVLL